MYRAETNIRHNGHHIINGETFDPAEYDMTDEQLAHLVKIGAVSDSKAKAAKADAGVSATTVADEAAGAEDEPATKEAKVEKPRRGGRRAANTGA